jgi:hypothetical protein
MTRGQGAFLDISTPGGVVMARWQSRWQGQGVTFEGALWRFAPFEWSGLSTGGIATSSPATLTLPTLPSLRTVLIDASREAWRGRLRVFQWAPEDDGAAPSVNQLLVATHAGTIALESITDTTISALIDSALLAPNGGRFPPTVASTRLIGTPCVLGGN